jgi:hypothetical protein
MFFLLLAIGLFVCAVYWFKVRADSIESDCEGMVEPGTRQPYGSWVWSMVTRRSD